MKVDSKALDIFVWPEIFRPIGPGDDMIVSAEKLTAYIAAQDEILKELTDIRESGFDSLSKTYSPDWVFERLEARIKKLESELRN